jgi:3-methyladenine DNA glycosylase AlkD
MVQTAKSVMKELALVSDMQKAVFVARYFKTGKGEYGEGDIFIGVTVPAVRVVAKKYREMPLSEVQILLTSKIHEHRLAALLILCLQYKKADAEGKKNIFHVYLKHTAYINNWDLVDTSARDIVGQYIFEHQTKIERMKFLKKYAGSKSLWERRIAVISTAYGISKGYFDEICIISEILLKDTHDLIHKALGWMLREMGKKNKEGEQRLLKFLDENAFKMPRTMLRYSLERLDIKARKRYMAVGK